MRVIASMRCVNIEAGARTLLASWWSASSTGEGLDRRVVSDVSDVCLQSLMALSPFPEHSSMFSGASVNRRGEQTVDFTVSCLLVYNKWTEVLD